MTRNPYLSRLPVEEPREFRGRRREVRLIMETIGASRPGSISVVGYRRIGKTSTLRFIQDHTGAAAEFEPLLAHPADRYLFVFVDLEFLRIEDGSDSDAAITFFRYLLTRVHHAVEKRIELQHGFVPPSVADSLTERYKTSIQNTNTYSLVTEGLEEYLRELTSDGVVPVLLLDEADVVVRRGFSSALRSLVSTVELAYVLATQSPLHELDPEQELSPLFNLCTPVPLGLLDASAARALVAGPAEAVGAAFSPDELEFLLRLGGGHPDFLKVAAMRVFDARSQGELPPCLDDLIPSIATMLEGSCKSIMRGINKRERALVRHLAEGRAADLSRAEGDTLRERGLAVGQGAAMEVFSPIFRDHVLRSPLAEPAAPAAAPPPPSDGITFDSGHVTIGGAQLSLTPLEERILNVLWEHAGAPVSRREIYERAWQDGDYSPTRDATINVAVQRLRGKLKTELHNRLRIESARKEGYSLIV